MSPTYRKAINTAIFLVKVSLQVTACFTVTLAVNRQRICQHFQFVMEKDVVTDHALDGHVFQRHTVKTAAQCHLLCRDNCQCISMNYLPTIKEHNCELNDENKERKPDGLIFKSNARYYGLARSYTMEGGRHYVPGKDPCVNRCCQPNPCLHGGNCQEICDSNDVRFNCTCPASYLGKRCEIRCYGSCKEVFQMGVTQSGTYYICDGVTAIFYVYCDLDSESKFVWTLIQSFSFDQRTSLDDKGFGVDYPVGEDQPNINWRYYRLSLLHMKYLKRLSTHLRATCNFSGEGLQYTDYARTLLKSHNILATFDKKCVWYGQLNIRGIECFSCTALTSQKEGRPWFINSYASKPKGCDFDGKPGIGRSEHNFGWYAEGKVNPNHRCSSTNVSTTELWFGSKKSDI